MQTENDILTKMNETISKFLVHICDVRINVKDIKNSVNKIDNNYFIEDPNKVYPELLNIFDDTSMNELTHVLVSYKNKIDNNLKYVCDHEWIVDDVDIGPEMSQRITYCSLCEISKK
jgi:hypothetical protein